VLNVGLQFFEAQRSGKLPRISNTPWRGNSGLWDSIILPNGEQPKPSPSLVGLALPLAGGSSTAQQAFRCCACPLRHAPCPPPSPPRHTPLTLRSCCPARGAGKNYSLVGGWYDDGGMLKLSYTTAFTVSMLSWSYYEFRSGFVDSNNGDMVRPPPSMQCCCNPARGSSCRTCLRSLGIASLLPACRLPPHQPPPPPRSPTHPVRALLPSCPPTPGRHHHPLGC
jgi:hypothetical protein